MTRKRKKQAAFEQLSLENLPGWENAASPTPKATPSRSQRFSAKEAGTQYKVTPKAKSKRLNSPVNQNKQVAIEQTAAPCEIPKIPVYVGITFDLCQGIREVKENWEKNPVPSEVVFNCQALELASEYSCKPKSKEFFDPAEEYLLGRGGMVNIAVFVNLLRCYGTLAKWSDDFYRQHGRKRIGNFQFIPPNPKNPIGKLWKVMGIPGLTERPPKNQWMDDVDDVMEFQSRIVTPLLMVNKDNRHKVLAYVQEWLHYISKRISQKTSNNLWSLACEVIKNLVDHGQRGTFGISIWPSGQIEIIWSNPIDHLIWWPPEDTPPSLANSLLNSRGAGMPYIFKDLLPRYQGVLIINWKTHNLIFRSAGDFSIMGLKPRSDDYLPISILFQLHLFCPETRNRSLENVTH